jgi:glycosyltransferase involved in cell wall biosynthesis
VIAPLLTDPSCEFLGEIGEGQKGDFLGNASALLFPIDWPEPFGLVLIEAMACGTPVIAYSCGSVPELVEDGVTGILVNSMDEAVRAVDRIDRFSRWGCRRAFLERFSARRMASDYVKLYESLVCKGRGGCRR